MRDVYLLQTGAMKDEEMKVILLSVILSSYFSCHKDCPGITDKTFEILELLFPGVPIMLGLAKQMFLSGCLKYTNWCEGGQICLEVSNRIAGLFSGFVRKSRSHFKVILKSSSTQ